MPRLRLAKVAYKVCRRCSVFASPPADFHGLPVTDHLLLREGDYVMHRSYGIGRFEDITPVSTLEGEREYLVLQYGNGKIYVPYDQSGTLSYYRGPIVPTVSWLRTSPHGIMEYEGERCPRCKAEFDAELDHRGLHDRIILVGVDPPPYTLQKRRLCKNRAAHYHKVTRQDPPAKLSDFWENVCEPRGSRCPLCGSVTSQRPTSVWERQYGMLESLDELESREMLVGVEEAGSEEYAENGTRQVSDDA